MQYTTKQQNELHINLESKSMFLKFNVIGRKDGTALFENIAHPKCSIGNAHFIQCSCMNASRLFSPFQC